jgi:hypothetical protein
VNTCYFATVNFASDGSPATSVAQLPIGFDVGATRDVNGVGHEE